MCVCPGAGDDPPREGSTPRDAVAPGDTPHGPGPPSSSRGARPAAGGGCEGAAPGPPEPSPRRRAGRRAARRGSRPLRAGRSAPGERARGRCRCRVSLARCRKPRTAAATAGPPGRARGGRLRALPSRLRGLRGARRGPRVSVPRVASGGPPQPLPGGSAPGKGATSPRAGGAGRTGHLPGAERGRPRAAPAVGTGSSGPSPPPLRREPAGDADTRGAMPGKALPAGLAPPGAPRPSRGWPRSVPAGAGAGPEPPRPVRSEAAPGPGVPAPPPPPGMCRTAASRRPTDGAAAPRGAGAARGRSRQLLPPCGSGGAEPERHRGPERLLCRGSGSSARSPEEAPRVPPGDGPAALPTAVPPVRQQPAPSGALPGPGGAGAPGRHR